MLLNLAGKKAFVTGVANDRSIAWGIAQQLHAAGAELGFNYLPDEKNRFQKKVTDLVSPLNPAFILPLDVQNDAQVAETFAAIAQTWGTFDILIHCLAFAGKEELTGNFSATSRPGFGRALEVSAYSLPQLAAAARPLLNPGSSIVTLSYLGSVRAVPNYNVMGVAKAALEASVRYLSTEFGPDNIRVNAISAGPIRTLASSAVGGILDMIHHVEAVSPLRRTVTQTEVGNATAFLCSDLASGITGQVLYVDSGYNIVGM